MLGKCVSEDDVRQHGLLTDTQDIDFADHKKECLKSCKDKNIAWAAIIWGTECRCVNQEIQSGGKDCYDKCDNEMVEENDNNYNNEEYNNQVCLIATKLKEGRT